MLLQHIVEKLDAELNRLEQLRTVVSSLSGPCVYVFDQPIVLIPETATVSPTEPAPAPVPVRKLRPAGARRGPIARRQKAPAEPVALTAAIPIAPVVVSPAALAREGARLQRRIPEPAPKPEPGSLGSMIRALHLQANN